MKKQIKWNEAETISYSIYGSGIPIMLIHGFGEDQRIWKNQVEELEKTYQVLVPDLPGTGSSTLPSQQISIEMMADSILAILDHEKLDQVLMIGHSMGGYVTLAFADTFPDRLNAFSLVHSSAYPDDELKKENRRKSIRLIQHDGKEVFLNAMIPNLYSKSSAVTKTSEMQEHLTMAMEVSSTTLQAYYEAMIERPDRIHVLRNTKHPVQFVIGKEDNAVPFAQSIQQCAIPEISFVEILDEIGHSSMFEAPQRLSSILNSFCKYVFKL